MSVWLRGLSSSPALICSAVFEIAGSAPIRLRPRVALGRLVTLTAWGAVMPFRSATLFVFILFRLVPRSALRSSSATRLTERHHAPEPSKRCAGCVSCAAATRFETIVGIDLDRDVVEEKSIAFAQAARNADVAFVYYSGHAMQFAGSNFLMPMDAAFRRHESKSPRI